MDVFIFNLKTVHITMLNPNAAELFRTIFYSFEAGIANAISSSE